MHNVAMAIRSYLETHASAVPVDKRNTFLALAMARAIACELPLPTSPVTSLQLYYGNTVYSVVARIVGDFNEAYVVDTKQVMALTFAHYQLRYRLVFEPQAVISWFCGSPALTEVVPEDVAAVLVNEGASEALRVLLREFSAATRGALPEPVLQA